MYNSFDISHQPSEQYSSPAEKQSAQKKKLFKSREDNNMSFEKYKI